MESPRIPHIRVGKRDPVTEAKVAENLRQEAIIVAELRGAGFDVDTLMEVRDGGAKYRKALPILMHWLLQDISTDVKNELARCFAYPWARGAPARLLLDVYKSTPVSERDFRWAIGNSIDVAADRSLAPAIIDIVKNKANGTSRQMFVHSLGRLQGVGAEPVLISLLSDDDVAIYACQALGRLRVSAAVGPLTQLLQHPRSFVRREAAKTIKRITGKPPK